MLLHRRRRPIAATLAGLGALLALTTLRGAPAPAAGEAPQRPGGAMHAGEVVIPVVLATGAVASVLAIGDIVDIVGFTDTEPPRADVIARRARVFDLPSGAGLTGSTSSVVLIAVQERAALTVSAASEDGGVGLLLRDRSASQ